MPAFIDIKTEKVVQVNDKFEINCRGIYLTKGETKRLLSVEIKPSEDDDFIDVTGTSRDDFFLYWQYATEGEKTVTAKVVLTDEATPTPNLTTVELTSTIQCLTSDEDMLFSDDQDLKRIKSDVLNWLSAGKNSFKNYHREAQKQILEWFRVNGYMRPDGTPFEKSDFSDIEQVRLWSAHLTLSLLFKDQSNAVDDIFGRWSTEYEAKASIYRDTSYIQIDMNGDGIVNTFEALNLRNKSLTRR